MGLFPPAETTQRRDTAPLATHSRRPSAVVVPVVVALVLAVGLGTRGQSEIYPLAQWAMFSRVPATLDIWTLRIHSVDGTDLEGAPLVRDVPQLADGFASGTAYRQVDRYGRALLAVQNGHDRGDEVARLRRQVERRFGGHEVEYAVVNLRGDPLDLLAGGEPDREIDLGTYTSR